MTEEQADTTSLVEGTARLFRSVSAGRSWLRQPAGQVRQSGVKGCFTLKTGEADDVPLFMLPGAPGSVLQLAAVSFHLTNCGPVYAIKPRGYEEGELPLDHLEGMASYNIEILKAVRPIGPYVLAGYSVGGLIALEMARQLVAAGDIVPLVILLDTYPSRRYWRMACHGRILVSNAVRSVIDRLGAAPDDASLNQRWGGLLWYLSECRLPGIPRPPLIPEGASPASRRLYKMSVHAGENYRPKPYKGKVVFLQPEDVLNLEPQDPAQVWRKWLTDFEVRRVPGSHLTMVETDAAATAVAISGLLQRSVNHNERKD